jgi:hypothetical protein
MQGRGSVGEGRRHHWAIRGVPERDVGADLGSGSSVYSSLSLCASLGAHSE